MIPVLNEIGKSIPDEGASDMAKGQNKLKVKTTISGSVPAESLDEAISKQGKQGAGNQSAGKPQAGKRKAG